MCQVCAGIITMNMKDESHSACPNEVHIQVKYPNWYIIFYKCHFKKNGVISKKSNLNLWVKESFSEYVVFKSLVQEMNNSYQDGKWEDEIST